MAFNARNTRERGRQAEQIAADYLTKNGYRIVEKNFQCRLGEIDLIARHDGELVFVEVRSRHSSSALHPVFSVNRRKQNKMMQAAQVYVDRRFRKTPPFRFDVVLVTLDNPPIVEVVPNAIMAGFP